MTSNWGKTQWNRHVILFASVALICALPALLWPMGLEWRTGTVDRNEILIRALSGETITSWDYGLVRGTLAYSLLEWTAVLMNLATAMLAFAHFHVRRESISMVISIAAFWIGAMIAFHLLAFHGFSMPVANVRDFVHFNWTVAQGFMGLMLIGTAMLVIWGGKKHEMLQGRHLVVMAVVTSTVAYGLIMITARSADLPSWIRNEAVVSRPLELIPLALFMIAFFVALPRLHQVCQSTFSLALWTGTIPLAASQIYMAIPSAALFDPGFTTAQVLKVVAFSMIFGGLVFDYAHVCRSELRLKKRLTVSDRRIRLLLDNAIEAIIIFDDERRIRLWNRRANEVFGATQDQVQGCDVVEVLFPGDKNSSKRHREQFEGALQHYEENDDADILRQLRELKLVRDDDELTIEYSIVPATRLGQTIFAVLARDVTERRRLQSRMAQVDRLVAVGTLAAGVVHEIKNPLTYVSTNISLAQESMAGVESIASDCRKAAQRDPSPEQADVAGRLSEVVDEIDQSLRGAEKGCERIRRIINDMRILSRGHPGDVGPVSVQKAVNVALRMTRANLDPCIEIVTDLDDVPCVRADETRLSQVFVNLIMNAGQALEETSDSDPLIHVELTQRDEHYAVVRIRDTGPGMRDAVLSQIFQPFFTTKTPDNGTGLGLSLSKSIIEGFGGRIEVQSSPGKGTDFEILLPIFESNSGDLPPG